MRVAVFGLWHLGCVTAACLARGGHQVVGLDLSENTIEGLRGGVPPLHEPGLADLISEEQRAGRLGFTTDPDHAFAEAEVVWVAFDTPVDDEDRADLDWLRRQLEAVRFSLRRGTIVLVSSQVPVGFTAELERAWADQGLHFAVSPENLRLGKALACFLEPDRVIVGCRTPQVRQRLEALLAPFSSNIVWMSIESAEMTKHALNAFLATSVAFINELARLCEVVGADAKEVETGLKSEVRIGPRAYLSPGAAFAGGTLARDVRFLVGLAEREQVQTPLCAGVWASNQAHKGWVRQHLARLLAGLEAPVVSLLGLTYKPGTDTLRRSEAVELAGWLGERGVAVRAFDPVVQQLPGDLEKKLALCDNLAAALAGADVAVVTTEWPLFRDVSADTITGLMRRPQVLDPNHFLARSLREDSRVRYFATGLPARAA